MEKPSKILISIKNEKSLLFICLFIIFIVNSPNIFLGGNFYPKSGYDSLDSNVIWRKILVESGKIFSSNSEIIEPAMGGLPRLCYPSEFSFETLLYILFKPSDAYIINFILIQIIAFIGMILLLKRLYGDKYLWAIYFLSVSFSCLNFWPHAGISVAGLPLLFYSYLIVKDKFFLSIVIMFAYTIYSNFILTGIFILFILLMIQIKNFISKNFYLKQFLFLNLFLIFYILAEYRYFINLINPIFLSHRTDFVISTLSLKDIFNILFNMLFREYGHNVKMPIIIVILTFFFITFFSLKKIKINPDITKIICAILSISIISIIMQSDLIYNIYSKIGLLKTIQLQRFYWLLPPLYYVLLFVVLKEILKFSKNSKIVFAILIIQFIYIQSNNTNWKQTIKKEILGRKPGVITFNEFYSPQLYSEIKKYIGKNQSEYRIASLGLQPASALYNGFYTIDGYFPNYPKKYKDTFYKIIQNELKKDNELEKFFLNWGSICFILSYEMVKMLPRKGFVVPVFYKDKENIINELNINTNIMRKLKCMYLFSAFDIRNHSEIGLQFEKYFENENSPYGIFLYSLK